MKRGIKIFLLLLIGIIFFGCSKINNYINNKIRFNDLNSLSKIERYKLSSDGKYLAMKDNYNKLKILDLEELKLIEISLNDLNIYLETENHDIKFDIYKDNKYNVSIGVENKMNPSFYFGFSYHEEPRADESSLKPNRYGKSLSYGLDEITEQPDFKDEKNNIFTFYKNLMAFLYGNNIYIIDIKSKIILQKINIESIGKGGFNASIVFNLDGKSMILSNRDSKYKKIETKIDIKTKKSSIFSHDKYLSILQSQKNKNLKVIKNKDNSLSIYSLLKNKKLITIKLFKNPNRGKSVTILGKKYKNTNPDSWLAITPEGYYTGSPDAYKYLNVDKEYEKFYRPDIVKLAMQGKTVYGLTNISDIKAPPKVEILNNATKTYRDNINIVVKITPRSGGVGDIRIYHNGTAISDTKAFRQQKNMGKSFIKSYNIKLVNGKNEIKAIAFEHTNSKRSEYAIFNVFCNVKTVVKPNIYALVIGIEDFRNPTLKLDYPQEDAKLFGEVLNTQEGGIFNKVFVTTLDTKESTTKENILAQLDKFKSIGKNDIFILYISSHGTVYKGEYFLITSNVGSLSNNRLKDEALSGHTIQKSISNIPALKKLMIFDTCYAGALGEILGKTIKTKGLIEKRAIDVLNHATGSAILSASTSSQEAIANGYHGHSIFTYILVDGLKGKADSGRKDGIVNTTELAAYLDEEVPLISKDVFNYEQFPVNNTNGQAFPISKVR